MSLRTATLIARRLSLTGVEKEQFLKESERASLKRPARSNFRRQLELEPEQLAFVSSRDHWRCFEVLRLTEPRLAVKAIGQTLSLPQRSVIKVLDDLCKAGVASRTEGGYRTLCDDFFARTASRSIAAAIRIDVLKDIAAQLHSDGPERATAVFFTYRSHDEEKILKKMRRFARTVAADHRRTDSDALGEMVVAWVTSPMKGIVDE